VNAAAEASIDALVDRALARIERLDSMTESAITDVRHAERVIRAADAAAHADLRKLLSEVDTRQADDITAYAEAMAERAPKVPAAKAVKDAARIKDLEQRVIPGHDEALWLLVGSTRTVLEPAVDSDWLTRQLPRWVKPKVIRDPSNILAEQHGKPRPADVVDWVLAGIDRVARAEEEKEAKETKDSRQKAMAAKVGAAQAAYDRARSISLSEEEAGMAPGAVASRHIAQAASGTTPWPPFNRYAWLRDNDPDNHYGYVQPGQSIQTKGGRERVIEQVPAGDADRSAYTEA
jgi:hypothetical protein